jgi:hypothetical protein
MHAGLRYSLEIPRRGTQKENGENGERSSKKWMKPVFRTEVMVAK